MINASIITIRDELLIGQVADTNSAWMAQILNKTGLSVRRRVAVGDNWDDITEALSEEARYSKVVLITGGLGPTADDITKEVLCAYFKGSMVIHEETLARIVYLFETIFKKPVTERNKKQAEVPDNCTVLTNTRGSAPGMLFQKDDVLFISMPGVPHEMKGIMEEEVIPLLQKKIALPFIEHRTLLTFDVGESVLADLLIEFEKALPSYIKLAYLPNFGQVRLRLSASGENKEKISRELDKYFLNMCETAGPFMVTNADEKMEEVVGKLLKARNKTVSTAESCTGGYIAHLITAVPGASQYYEASIVSYSYKAKEKLLNVSKELLQEKGAVSEEIVIEMAKGVLNKTGSDFTIAVSGIMGPLGGLEGKPVGTVWLAAGSLSRIVTKRLNLRFDREKNIQVTAVHALNLLRKCIIDDVSSSTGK